MIIRIAFITTIALNTGCSVHTSQAPEAPRVTAQAPELVTVTYQDDRQRPATVDPSAQGYASAYVGTVGGVR